MSNLSLYELAADYRRIVERLESTQDDEQAIADTLEGEAYPLQVKAQGVAYYVKNSEAMAEALKKAEAEMAARRKRFEKAAERGKQYIHDCMVMAGMTKIECEHFALTIKKNPPSVDVFEPELVPIEFTTLPPPPEAVPNKKAIAEALKDGQDVPGARLVHSTRVEVK